MHCSDLERYLEAHLQNRLGTGRKRVLLRHLTMCSQCREKVIFLQKFEENLPNEFKATDDVFPVWNRIDTQLVTNSLLPLSGQLRDMVDKTPKKERPSPVRDATPIPLSGPLENKEQVKQKSPRRWPVGLAVLIGISSVMILSSLLYPSRQTEGVKELIQPSSIENVEHFSQTDPFILRHQLSLFLGQDLPLLPDGDGLKLSNASVLSTDGHQLISLDYTLDGVPVTVLIDLEASGILATLEAPSDKAMVSWSEGGASLAVFGPFSAEQLTAVTQ